MDESGRRYYPRSTVRPGTSPGRRTVSSLGSPMRTTPFRRLLLAAAIGAAAATPASLDAQQPLLFSAWTPFEWFFAPGPVEGSGFTFQSLHSVRVRVADTGFSGDAFTVFANGVQVATTPTVAEGLGTGTFDADEAWADPALSKVEFLLAPGLYTITLNVREAGLGFADGFGHIRADEIVSSGVVPEPASVALLAGGLAALGATLRRVRRRPAAR